MQISNCTRALLEDLERRIDPDVEDDLHAQWGRFWDGTYDGVIFTPQRKAVTAPGVELKAININDAIGDAELMLQSELISAGRALSGETHIPCVRANYGTGIMTSLFGAEIFVMPYETNTLPTTKSLNDTEAIERILAAGAPDLTGGFGQKVFDMGESFAELFRDYPKVEKYVYVYHPDLQGPLDIAELLWGGEMFYSLYDEPELVHGLLRLITDTYRRFLDRWYTIIPRREGMNVHWGWMHRGTIMLRSDSAMNLSPEMYGEFALPYDRELLEVYGGGCVHFCGRGDHYIDQLTALPLLHGVNMSQPHYNDMDKILQAVGGQNKRLLNLRPEACRDYIARPDAQPGIIHGRLP